MPDGAATTPLMEQYEGVKARYPGHLVLVRVGDFFEAFGDDAKLLSRELELVLTARSPDSQGERTPMAGVPHHAVETYLARLVRKGYRVALCDQVEDPRLAKGLVRREVTRVVTPGTAVEDRILPGAEHNFLACLLPVDGAAWAYAVVDVTTGEWFHGLASAPGADAAVSELAPYGPSEVLLASAERGRPDVAERLLRQDLPRARLDRAPPPLAEVERPSFLKGPSDGPSVDDCDLRLAAYVRATQPRLLPYLEVIRTADRPPALRLDAKTLRHLEISRPMNPDDPTGATLVSTWDETVTSPGRRTISFWLRTPLADAPVIHRRHEAVEALVRRGAELAALRRSLGPVADLSRVAARCASRRIRPPELLALRTSLEAVQEARRWLSQTEQPPALAELASRLDPLPDLLERLRRAVPENPPATPDSPGLFRPGYSPGVDAQTERERAGLDRLEALERREQEASGIRGLKIGYNQVFGYYLDVTRPNLGRVPPHFRRKQTLASGERFTTDELVAVETEILEARERREEEEAHAWELFLAEVDRYVPALHRLSRAVGELDALASFAVLAQERRLVRPVVDTSTVLQVRDGRHPILDRLLSRSFVPNDVDLSADDARLLVLTGPNMSGKSTYMRQIGLLVVLAQAGSFVPASYARVGIVSSLFTRMGFTDEIGRGKSSFMVEMSEVADILRSADERSLVLLDEVGRGTSTFDGLALAWATLRHLHDRVGCRTVLATHYHHLTELIEGLKAAKNAHLAVQETAGEVVFLHRLVPGSTDRSYGLHVARLAGLPTPLLEEAERLLKHLESEGVDLPSGARRRAGPKYTQAILLTPAEPRASLVEEALRSLDPETMTPMDALAWIATWRRRLEPPERPTLP